MELNFNFLPAVVLFACFFVVIFTELIKSLDKKNRLKGYRVYIPFLLSGATAFLLVLGDFITAVQAWFWGAVIFGISVFFFEAILRKITKIREDG